MSRSKLAGRRSFMRGSVLAGTGILAAQTGLVAAQDSEQPALCVEQVQKWDEEAEVVVLGLGAAGVAATDAAFDAGADVLVLEKMSAGGGNAALSGGSVYASGTKPQEEAGIEDSADEMFNYWMAVNEGIVNPEIARTLADNSAGMVDWLIAEGCEIDPALVYFSGHEMEFEDAAVPAQRGHLITGRGVGMMEILVAGVEKRGVRVLYDTAATRLIVAADGSVAGVVAQSGDDEIYVKATKAVIIATGGMARNGRLLNSFYPILSKAAPFCAPGLTADGMLMAAKIGAPIMGTGMLNVQLAPPGLEVKPFEQAATLAMAYFMYKYPTVFVNQEGVRFIAESEFYETLSKAVMEQEGAYIIFDQKALDDAGGQIGYGYSEGFEDELESGLIIKAETIAEVAEGLGLDPEVVEETVSVYNENATDGKDPDFNKEKALAPVENPPYYGFKLTAAFNETTGGTAINTSAQVLDAYGEPIRRLYAAGSTTESMRRYPGSGSYCTHAFVFGLIAGENAAAEEPVEEDAE